jgi:hypothetical protein
MRQKILIVMAVVLVACLTLVSSWPAGTVQADDLLQGMPSLEGYNIYFTEDADEASRFDRSFEGLSRFTGLLRKMGASLHTLEWRERFPENADLIVVAGPTGSLSPDEIARLWAYVNNNGRLLLLADPPVDGSRALRQDSGLFRLMWGDMGIRGEDDVVVLEGVGIPARSFGDEDSGEQILGGTTEVINSFVTTTIADNHPITEGIDSLAFFVARSLEFDASIQQFVVTPLVFTNNDFYGETEYDDYLDDELPIAYNIGDDNTRGPLALAAAFENATSGTRMVVVGDREFATNGGGLVTSPPNSASFVYPDNARFLLNAVTWLLEEEAADLAFPTPAATATPTITPSPVPVSAEDDSSSSD